MCTTSFPHSKQYVFKKEKELRKMHMTIVSVVPVQPIHRAPEIWLFGLGPEWSGAWSIGVE